MPSQGKCLSLAPLARQHGDTGECRLWPGHLGSKPEMQGRLCNQECVTWSPSFSPPPWWHLGSNWTFQNGISVPPRVTKLIHNRSDSKFCHFTTTIVHTLTKIYQNKMNSLMLCNWLKPTVVNRIMLLSRYPCPNPWNKGLCYPTWKKVWRAAIAFRKDQSLRLMRGHAPHVAKPHTSSSLEGKALPGQLQPKAMVDLRL